MRGPVRSHKGRGGLADAWGGGHFTLHEVRVVGLVGRQHGGHLVMVCRVDVLVNAVAGQLYL